MALGQELTYKVYTDRQRGFGNEVIYESSRMNYMSMENKLKLVQMVDRMSLLPNEWRAIMNLPPIEGGDKPLYWQNPKINEGQEEPAAGKEPEKGEEDASQTE